LDAVSFDAQSTDVADDDNDASSSSDTAVEGTVEDDEDEDDTMATPGSIDSMLPAAKS
jgi:hypothetical protein